MDPYSLDTPESPQAQGFHALMRFLRVVRRHKAILIGFVAASAFLAVVYHKRTPKEYETSAKLMVRQLQADASDYRPGAANSLLASYRQLLLSDKVLIETVRSLKTRPTELRGRKRESEWPGILRNMIRVEFDKAGTVLEVRCRALEPEATAYIINALTTTSAKFMEDFQQNETYEIVEKLDERLQAVESELRATEQKLLAARKACGDISVNENSDEVHPLLQRVSFLSKARTEVQKERLELESMLMSARRLVASNSDLTLALQKLEGLLGSNVMAQLPGMAPNNPELLQELNDELTTMQAELAALRRHFGSRHSEIIRRETALQTLMSRIAVVKNESRRSVDIGVRDPQVGQWLITTIEAELQSRRSYEQSLEAEYRQAERDALDLSNTLASIQVDERQAEILRQSHASLLNRLQSINIQPSGGLFKVAPLTDPPVPGGAVYPVMSRILIMFCGAGVALALGLIYAIDLMDDRLRSPEEVKDELGLSVLGVIRRLPSDEVDSCKIYVHGFPQTPHAECFRTLKTSLTLSPMETKCLAITSTEASEGKTTTTVNLAASYAQTGLRTLLIDADMRRPGLSRLLEVRGHGGLSEVLRAETGIPEMCRERIVQTEVPLLDVMPCGPRILNAGMLLSMPALADILDWAVAEYDQVIVDCPPTLPVSDAAIVGRFVDGMLFLMNPDKTHRRSVARAVDQLRSMDLKIVGIVANTSLSEDKNSYGYQYGYGYGYGVEYTYGHDDDADGLDMHDEGLSGTTSGFGKAA